MCSEKCKQDYEKAHAPQDNVDNGRKMLFDYIKTVAPDVNFRLVGIQLANLMKEYPDMTYNGIAYTIKYIKNYLGLDVSETPPLMPFTMLGKGRELAIVLSTRLACCRLSTLPW